MNGLGLYGPILGLCWPILRAIWAHLRSMLAHLGAMLAHLGPILGLGWPILGLCWPIFPKYIRIFHGNMHIFVYFLAGCRKRLLPRLAKSTFHCEFFPWDNAYFHLFVKYMPRFRQNQRNICIFCSQPKSLEPSKMHNSMKTLVWTKSTKYEIFQMACCVLQVAFVWHSSAPRTMSQG